MYFSASCHPTTLWQSARMEGCGHGLLDFHAFTKESLTYNCQSPKVLKTGLGRRRRRLVSGPGFEKMGVAS